MTQILSVFSRLTMSITILCLIAACQSRPKRIDYNPAFDAYLSAFTNGEVSKKASIIVRFAKDLVKNTKEPVPAELVKFTPKLKGEAVWRDSRTVEFIPSGDLKSGQIYTAKVDMRQLFGKIPADLSSFAFQFKAKDQYVNVSPTAADVFGSDEDKYYRLKGTLTTNDAEDEAVLENILKVLNGNKTTAVIWEHKSAHEHNFTIDSVARGKKPYKVKVTWDGKDIQSGTKGNLWFDVPSISEFKYTNHYRHNSPEQYLVLEFSDALDPHQSLDGLIRLGDKPLKYSIENNIIKVYPGQKLLGKLPLTITAGIKNENGKTLEAPTTENITFSDAIPAVQIVGSGNIIPRSQKMPIIFKSINLNAVDVRVVKIKEDNVQQFLQVNQIEGSNEMKRVGKVVLQKRLDLDKTKGLDLGDWTHHSLELAGLIEPEAGAIYEIAIGFRKSYVLNECDEEAPKDKQKETDMLELTGWDNPTYEASYWDWYEGDYNWEEKDNPCTPSFYTSTRVARRNVLASDLGIVAKKGDNGNLYIVNNIQTTAPMEGVILEFYDYQQDLIASVKTDKDGMAKANFDKVAFLLVAKSGKQRGYLRLDDPSALSMSRFDVAGTSSVKGIKGFIYGERGVWRPGDELFLNFILEDKEKSLPASHPISFELKDPRGAVVQRLSVSEGVHGIYNFSCKTDDKSPTGNYTAIVRVGGATFAKTLKIETIKPNRLKMALNFGADEIDASLGMISGTVNAKWLHGAVGKNLKAKMEMSLRDANTTFKQFPDYNFNDPATSVESSSRVVYDGKLNESGDAKFSVKLPKNLYAAGMVNAVFRTQVFEPGGDFSIDQTSVAVHPYKTYVGLRLPSGDSKRNMLLTDIKHRVEIATVDKSGKPVQKTNIEVKVYKLDWRWWFDQNKGEVSSYRGKINSEAVAQGKVSTAANGVAVYEMEVKYPEWGRYLVRACDSDGHCSGQIFYIDWPGWAGKSREGDPEGATALNVTSDKEKYNVGEEVTLNIPSGFAGRALVTIESGSRILEAKWVTAEKGTTQYKFQTTKGMAPNIYAYVTLLQPHAQTKNDLPIRMYGVIPIMVEDPTTRIEPTIAMSSNELKPMEDFTVTVAERKGGPMAYTIAIVDEGLLDLTRFPTPAPWAAFYQKEALGVKTWDMYNSVLGAFGGEVKSLLSIGGDAATNAEKNKKKNDRFKPVVLTAGPFFLPAGKTEKHTFKMPNYVGSVRVMVIAAEEGAYGAAEKAVPVRQPLMVVASIPRTLGPGETFKLPVTVFAMKEGINNAEVTIAGNDLVEVVGANMRTVTFSGIGEEMAYFEMKVKERAGMGNVKISVKGAGNTADYETDIEVRLANPRTSEVFAAAVDANKTWEQAYKPIGVSGTNTGVLEVSSVPPLNLGRRLSYLIQYPYGCVEQTTSGAFPQLYLARLMELSDANKEKIDANVKVAIKRLQSFQNSSGGMGYWPGDNQANEWSTNYAGHFLIEADKAGYAVPKELMKKWTEYQKSRANEWASTGNAQEDLTQAYRLYLLALAGKTEMGAMNRMRLKSIHKDAIAARWHLAAAYQLAGQKDVAKDIVANTTTDIIEYAKGTTAATFGSQLRDQALVLQTLSILDQRSKADGLLKVISARLAGEQWLSTQETAQALVAMAKYVGEGGVSRNLEFEYRISGGSWQKMKSNKPVWQLDLAGEASTKVEFKNNSGQITFARLVAEGIPAAGNETDAANGMSISVAYQTLEGKNLDISRMQQGEEFMAAVTVKNTGAYAYNELALHQVFPSGWEVINHRLLGIKLNGDLPEYQDIRDDRIYSFFDLPSGKSKTFYVRLNATYLGRYYLPALSVEAMYDKSLSARRKGQWIEVVAQNDK